MKDPPKAGSTTPSDVVRVFVASTFSDMRQERDVLVQRVFPELRRRCRQRGVEFVEVYPGRSHGTKVAEPSESLGIWLTEMDNCRPYFIGILGEQYGSVPSQIDPELVANHLWLVGHLDKSIVELEILHAALNDPSSARHAYFYFRDPAYRERDTQQFDVDPDLEAEEAHGKLEALKDQIRASGLPLRDNYPDPGTVCQMILSDLWAAIAEELTPSQPPDPLEQETREHEGFASSRTGVFAGREDYFGRLNEHAKGNGPPLVLFGEPGIGKSALLAHWSATYSDAEPDEVVICHFAGSSPGSGEDISVMRRVLAEIKQRYDIDETIPDTRESLERAFPAWLLTAGSRDRFVLIMAGVDSPDDLGEGHGMRWIPNSVPDNVRLVVSVSQEPSLDALKERGWQLLELAGLSSDERRAVVAKFLALCNKSLPADLVERIVEAPQTGNPLFLRALLEECRVAGMRADLDAVISSYLEAHTVEDLYGKILERLERDHETHRPRLVCNALTLLWAARRGLYESELLELLSDANTPLPREIWSPFFLALNGIVVHRNGMLGLFHPAVRGAVRNRYLKSPEAQAARHLRLALYFRMRETGARRADELPWQLKEARAWESLGRTLSEPDTFGRLSARYRLCELNDYWSRATYESDISRFLEESMLRLAASLPAEEKLGILLTRAADLLTLHERPGSAEALYRRALDILEASIGKDHVQVADVLDKLGQALVGRNDRDAAKSFFARALQIRERALGQEHPDTTESVRVLASILRDEGPDSASDR